LTDKFKYKPQPRRGLPMFSADDPDRVIPTHGVCELTGLNSRNSRLSLYDRMKADPEFPRPVLKIGGRNYWREADVRAWIRGQIAAQAAASPPTRPRTRLIVAK
jgi:predicted DNA-binding transcriptional regulator AlpA